MRKTIVYPSRLELFEAAAEYLADKSNSAVSALGRCAMALPGGNTPRGLFRLLAESPYRSTLDWFKTHFFWGDERCVPWDHRESNYRLAYQTFLAPLSVPRSNLHGVVSENRSPHQAAEEYEQEIRRFFNLRASAYPRFDLILLGLGSDGHTASLFPNGPELDVENRLVTWSQPDTSSLARVTFTLETINQARNVAFLVSGADKAAPIRSVLEGDQSLPAALVKPRDGELTFFLDKAAYGKKCFRP